ncbi:MAG: Serpin (serine protease inhibitor) [Anaerophaga sp.]|nr:Serpin (serine protease inhibitor) [Anaerophaga sp.]
MVFRVDRPFFFAIAEKESGAILFSGKIENPLE